MKLTHYPADGADGGLAARSEGRSRWKSTGAAV